MKTHFIRELEPNQVVTSFFIVHSKEVRLKKTGEPYLCLTLADRTGQLDAKMWDGVPEVADAFDQDDFVKVKGLVQVYRNRPQMTVHKLRRVEESDVDFADYFPHTDKNIEEMWAAVRAAVAGVRNEHLRALLNAFLDDEEVARRFKIAPAAKSLHHARLGGLLEHVVSLLGLCRLMAGHYDFIDLDLLVTAAVLHDLGKIYELHYERSFGYSTEGQLLGHMIIVLDMLQAKAAAVPGFPPKLKTLVEHLILSHHGHYEFGSPKLPMFPEALLFHYLDDLDSKLESMRATIAGDPNIDGDWTVYNASLERPLLKKEKFLREEAEKEPQPPATGGRVQGSATEPAGPSPAEASEDAAASRNTPAAASAEERGRTAPGMPAARPVQANQPAAPRPARPGGQTVFGELLHSALKEDGGSK
ncbi:MAG TPA: HD domain-containing protein [Bryobacterales bacterium]|nr:HD domain-containing protein [Bryobacterales bacterium]